MKSIALLLLVLVVISVIGSRLHPILFRKPPLKTQSVANNIFKYPKATKWQIKSTKSFCIIPEDCSPASLIILETNDQWAQIYSYYREYMPQYGWLTNSQVYTSVPSSIVFNNNSCQAILQPNKQFINGQTLKVYNFKVSCRQA